MRRIPQRFPFKIGTMECSPAIVKTDNVFGYSIEVDSKPLPVYKEQYQKKFDTWLPKIDGQVFRVVLDKVLLDLYSNGEKIENDRQFMDNGAVTYFKLANVPCRIEAQKTEKSIANIFYTPEGSVPLDTKQDAETFKFDAERFFNSGFDNL
ncbi:hypothetical protein CAEBREN_30167 [Caenorhabditis brenneri]|uniref:Uncharacterized protein n=1 Tax=Caenorhabditis brenneri TaxID=135651 RepID=G0MWN6_CAEBE|nr:hypothetical protein CAEBREN_30167 [Caenorhabditis brenneri]